MYTLLGLLFYAATTTTQTLDEGRGPEATTTIRLLIEREAVNFGVDKDLAVRIANCESSLRQFDKQGNVLKGKINPQDIGIFQINEKYHLAEAQKQGIDIYTTEGNIEYAMRLMKSQGTRPWNWSKSCWHANADLST